MSAVPKAVPESVSLREVEQFLYREAALLDHQQLEEWLRLYTEDAIYWVPLERDQKDPWNTSSIIFDDRTLLDRWMAQWADIVDFDVTPVVTSAEAVGVITPML